MASLTTSPRRVKASKGSARTRPERHMALGAVHGGVRCLKLTVGKKTTGYYVVPLESQLGGVAFRLERFASDVQPGEPDHYNLLLDTALPTRSLCDCKGFERWGWHQGADGQVVSCKHLDSCLALAAGGRI
jgi:hypothetical protein